MEEQVNDFDSQTVAPMRRLIIESPYAGDVERNIIYARRCVQDCLRRNDAPIASHLLFTQPGILDDNKLEERALGIAAGLAWLPVAQASIFYIDYGISSGMAKGLEAAIRYHQINSEFIIEQRSIGVNP